MFEGLQQKLGESLQASILSWLQSLPGMALDYFGWGGIIGIAAGLMLLMTMSARMVKLLCSRRGMAVLAVIAIAAIYFMPSWDSGDQDVAERTDEPEAAVEKMASLTPINPEADLMSSLASLQPAPSFSSPISAFAIQHPGGGAGSPIINAAHHTVAPTHHATSHVNNPAAGVHSLMPHGGSAGGTANHQLASTMPVHAAASQVKSPLGSSALNGLAVNHKTHAPARTHQGYTGGGFTGTASSSISQPYGPVHSSYPAGGGGHYQQQQMTPQEVRAYKNRVNNRIAEMQMNMIFANPGNYMPGMNGMTHMGGGMSHMGGGMQHTAGVHHPYHH